MNPAWCRLAGIDAGVASGEGWHRAVHPDDLPGVLASWGQAAEGALRELSGELRLVRPGGEVVWVRVSAAPVPEGGPFADGWIGSMVDVTADRAAAAEQRSREELAQALDRVRVAVRAGRFGLWEDDGSGHLQWAPRAREIFGFPASGPITDAQFFARVHPDDRAHLRSVIRAAEEGGPDEYTVTYRIDREGEERWIESRGAVWRDEGRAPRHYGVLQDVTDAKHLERRLREADRLAAVGNLAGGMAHEVNNQLAVVLGFGEMLARKLAPDERASAQIRHVMEAGRRAAVVTRQVLAFGRRQALRPEVLGVTDLFRRSEGVLRGVAGPSRNLTFATRGAPLGVEVDPDQAEHVLVALVQNARDATGPGGQIEVATRPWGPPGGAPTHVELSVRDDGRGMAADVQARAFEPFFTTKSLGEGTGLGLPSVHGIVAQSGGTVGIESAPGEGTTVWIRLPIATAAPHRAAEEPTGGGEARTLLVVDDEPAVVALAREALTGAGYRVLTASSAREALDLIAGEVPIHAVISDVAMPDLDGGRLYEAATSHRPNLPFVFMSGYLGASARRDFSLPDDAPVLDKPFEMVALFEAVARVTA